MKVTDIIFSVQRYFKNLIMLHMSSKWGKREKIYNNIHAKSQGSLLVLWSNSRTGKIEESMMATHC